MVACCDKFHGIPFVRVRSDGFGYVRYADKGTPSVGRELPAQVEPSPPEHNRHSDPVSHTYLNRVKCSQHVSFSCGLETFGSFGNSLISCEKSESS